MNLCVSRVSEKRAPEKRNEELPDRQEYVKSMPSHLDVRPTSFHSNFSALNVNVTVI